MTRILAVLLLTALVAGCGSSSSSSSTSSGSSSSSSSPAQAPSGALSGEAGSAATGDIPDTQNFLTYQGAGFSIKYPEGWAQTGSGGDISFRDKNNIVHVLLGPGAQPTAASVTATLNKQKARTPSLKAGTPQPYALKAGKAFKVTYTTVSKPNPVTGKRVTLMVDRYVVAHGGKVATIDLGTPTGVDNVDAYKMMALSFQWR
jgi:hypothetical protein